MGFTTTLNGLEFLENLALYRLTYNICFILIRTATKNICDLHDTIITSLDLIKIQYILK